MKKILKEEFKTWNLSDQAERDEKIERERVRYPKMLEDMGITLLDTVGKTVVDVGSGPISALQYIEAGYKVAVDPLVDEYAKLYYILDPTIWWINAEIDGDIFLQDEYYDLAICMNALDHFDKPATAISRIERALVPGGFFGVHCCIKNAIYNPHPAHIHNITYELFREWVDESFETVHEKFVRYSWRKYKGKVGQLAFAWLGRKVLGYKEK